jgi:Glyoxalase-like domain
MTARPHNITFDCADPYRLAGFWSEVTGYREDPDNGNAPEDSEGCWWAGRPAQPAVHPGARGQDRQEPRSSGPHADTAHPRPGGGPAARAGRRDGGRPPSARRYRLGGACRPGRQRVLCRAQRPRAHGRSGRHRLTTATPASSPGAASNHTWRTSERLLLLIRCCADNRGSDGGRGPQRRSCPLAARAGRLDGPVGRSFARVKLRQRPGRSCSE